LILLLTNSYLKDQNGCITTAELGKIVRALGNNASDIEVEAMMKEVDKDGDGVITQEEYLEMMSKQLEDVNEREMKKAFSVFDKNGNGLISSEEVKTVMASLGNYLAFLRSYLL
jgi:calmodulin